MPYRMLYFLPQIRNRRRITYRLPELKRFLGQNLYEQLDGLPYDIFMYRIVSISERYDFLKAIEIQKTRGYLCFYDLKLYYTHFYPLRVGICFTYRNRRITYEGDARTPNKQYDETYKTLIYCVNMASFVYNAKQKLIDIIINSQSKKDYNKIQKFTYYTRLTYNPFLVIHILSNPSVRYLYTLYSKGDNLIVLEAMPRIVPESPKNHAFDLPKSNNFILYGYRIVEKESEEWHVANDFKNQFEKKIIYPTLREEMKEEIESVLKYFIDRFEIINVIKVKNMYIVNTMFSILTMKHQIRSNEEQFMEILQKIVYALSGVVVNIRTFILTHEITYNTHYTCYMPMTFVLKVK